VNGSIEIHGEQQVQQLVAQLVWQHVASVKALECSLLGVCDMVVVVALYVTTRRHASQARCTCVCVSPAILSLSRLHHSQTKR